MSEIPDPRIRATGALASLTDRVLIPSAFTAVFDGEPKVTLKVVVEDRKPLVRSFEVACRKGGLGTTQASVPLHSKLLPAAVAAASQSLIAGAPPSVRTRARKRSLVGTVGVVGSITVSARLESDIEAYTSGAGGTRRGRPPLVVPDDELAAIAETYLSSGGSISAVRSGFNFSKSTAQRRVEKARQAGLIDKEEAT